MIIKEKDKSITPLDLVILNILFKEGMTNIFWCISVKDLYSKLNNVGISTLYRRVSVLYKMGYLEKGFKTGKQDTYHMNGEALLLLEQYDKYRKERKND